MKQKNFALFAAVMPVVLLLASCRNMEEDSPQPRESHILTAYLEAEPDTKTHLSEPDSKGIYYPYWSARDAIAVYVDGINQPDLYSLESGQGTVKGTFSGVLHGQRLVGLYPYSSKTKEGLQGNVLTLELPSEQSYVQGSFGQGAFPMVAVGENGSLTFKNLCAVLRLSLTGSVAVQSITFSPHDSWMPVSGKATVRTDFSGEPVLVMADDGSGEVTLQCGFVELNPSTPTDFFLVIPPGTYTGGFTVKIKTFNGTVTKSTHADVTFNRSQLRSIPAFECAADGEIDADNIPYNEIWYTASYKIGLSSDAFDQEVVSHTFEKGKGVIRFAGPVTEVSRYALYNYRIFSIHLPDCVKTIGEYAFAYTSIEAFRTPSQLQSVGVRAFYSCENLARFYGKWASADEKSLVLGDGTMAAYTNVVSDPVPLVPEGVKTLVNYLFDGNEVIREMYLPEGVESLGVCCFRDCISLEIVSLPSTLTYLGDGVFEGCEHLQTFAGDSEYVLDSHALVKNGSMFAFAGSGVEDYSIPEGVSEIQNGAFSNCPDLRSLTFPSTLNNLYSGFIYNCPKLEFFYGPGTSEDHHCLVLYGDYLVAVTPVTPSEITIPDGVERIFVSVFRDNNCIERLTIPDAVYFMHNYALGYMPNLKELTMPASLTDVWDDPFAGDLSLEKIYMRSFTPFTLYEYDHESYRWGADNLVIYVPKGFEDQYKNASGWDKYADRIQGFVYDDLQDPDYYLSTDYSHDGEVTLHQAASVGNGINLVLLGDAYSDRQIAEGLYDQAMNKMIDAFFSEEPYTTYRNMFNVYSVKVVSATEGYDHGGQALSGYFGEGTKVGGNDNKCIEYAKKAVPADEIDNTLIIVAMNRDYYAGTCYMYYPSAGDYGCGLSVAYFPTSSDEDTFKGLVRHEAGGHGFSKLGDEYAYEAMGTIPEDEMEGHLANAEFGWWKNCDFTNDPTQVKWSRFLSDSRYQWEGLGCYEGGLTYWKGVWRPTENSIMRYNTGGFNAPSREAIWYRMHKLAYGESWEYNYEDFVAYDMKNWKAASQAAARGNAVERRMEPLAPPVVIPRRWNDPAAASYQQQRRPAPLSPSRPPLYDGSPVSTR